MGEELSYERKIREMIVAARIEATLSKDEILEIYLNSVYLGRSSWGVEMAARSYFGKPAKQLRLEEGALLAGLTRDRDISVRTGNRPVPSSGSPMCSTRCGRPGCSALRQRDEEPRGDCPHCRP